MSADHMDRGASIEMHRNLTGSVSRAAADRAQRQSLNGDPAEDVTPHIHAKKAA